jgi:hypothetical protein
VESQTSIITLILVGIIDRYFREPCERKTQAMANAEFNHASVRMAATIRIAYTKKQSCFW